MDIASKKETIINAVYGICKKNDVEVWCDLSNSTKSMYFWIKYGVVRCKFRISDHMSFDKKMKSITIKETTKIPQIEKFVDNRIKDLKMLYTKLALKSLNGVYPNFVACG